MTGQVPALQIINTENPAQTDPWLIPLMPQFIEFVGGIEPWTHLSQNGEDAVIEAVFERIGTENKWCCEVGAGDGVRFSNTRWLIEDGGWSGVQIESDPGLYAQLCQNYLSFAERVLLLNSRIAGSGETTLAECLKATDIPRDFDLLALDIDGQEVWILNSLLEYRPRVIICEFNPHADAGFIPSLGGDGQASLRQTINVGVGKGYAPVCRLGQNIVFVRQAAAPKLASGAQRCPHGQAIVEHEEFSKQAQTCCECCGRYTEIELKESARCQACGGVAPQAAVKLNLGAGEWKDHLLGYANLDGATGDSLYPLAARDGSTFADASVDEVRASHVLEHFDRGSVPDVLREWVRVLKPGAWLKLAVPNFEWIAEQFQQGNGKNWPLEAYIMGGQLDERDLHRSIYTRDKLTALMRRAGLVAIQDWRSEAQDCAALPVSLNLMGRKPVVRNDDRVMIAAVMSVPRYCQTATLHEIEQGLIRAGVALGIGWGCYFHHGLSRAIKNVLDVGDGNGQQFDYILTLDSDVVFNVAALSNLVLALADNPEWDVIVPMQARRCHNELLAGYAGTMDFSKPIIPLHHGHFGMTLFRRSVFERLSKPWFEERPDDDGDWTDGRRDADMSFWDKAKQAEIRVGLATRIIVGHMDEVVLYPQLKNGQYTTVFQFMTDWQKDRQLPDDVGVVAF